MCYYIETPRGIALTTRMNKIQHTQKSRFVVAQEVAAVIGNNALGIDLIFPEWKQKESKNSTFSTFSTEFKRFQLEIQLFQQDSKRFQLFN